MDQWICFFSSDPGGSPDRKTMYFTESFRRRIFAYDFDAASGDNSNRRIFVSLDPYESAFPDGMRIVRYDPKGAITRIIELPVSRGTGVMFGGPDLGTLYVTTMRTTLSDDQLAQEPLAGSLLALRPGVQGLPETPFAG